MSHRGITTLVFFFNVEHTVNLHYVESSYVWPFLQIQMESLFYRAVLHVILRDHYSSFKRYHTAVYIWHHFNMRNYSKCVEL